MISGLLKARKHEEAIYIFREMESSIISPNSFNYAGFVSACASSMGLHLRARIPSSIVIRTCFIHWQLVGIFAQ
jgi:pentatricopeptide repeat protein